MSANRNRRGFTLAEMLVSITLLTIVIALAVPFFRTQTLAIAKHAGVLEASLSANFGIDAIERDLRAGGIGVVDAQPLFVQASADAITIQADLVTRNASDLGAVYVDPDASALTTTALTPALRITLPLSAVGFPDSAFKQGVIASMAETISYWVSKDSSSSKPDEYILWRRVNATTPQVVSKGIKKVSGDPIFKYYKTDSVGRPTEITTLPLYHKAAYHDSPTDVGANALIDSIRVVRVKLTGVQRDARQGDATVTLERSVRVMNAGLIKRNTCGEAPLMAGPILATPVIGGVPSVSLTWPKSSDESGGEKDVERYVIFRRIAGTVDFGEPMTSVAAGLASYDYIDTQVKPAKSYEYAIMAQDCTPQSSSPIVSNVAIVP